MFIADYLMEPLLVLSGSTGNGDGAAGAEGKEGS